MGRANDQNDSRTNPKRSRPSETMMARRAPSTTAAVHYALINGKGSKKAVRAYPKVEGAPDAVQTEVENHLRPLKKKDPPNGESRGGWHVHRRRPVLMCPTITQR